MFPDGRNNTLWTSRKDSVHDEKIEAAGEKRVAGRLSWKNRERVRPSEGVEMIHPQEQAGRRVCTSTNTSRWIEVVM